MVLEIPVDAARVLKLQWVLQTEVAACNERMIIWRRSRRRRRKVTRSGLVVLSTQFPVRPAPTCRRSCRQARAPDDQCVGFAIRGGQHDQGFGR